MKVEQAKTTMRQLINMYSERGAVINSNDKNIADFELKSVNYLNIALKTVTNRFPMIETLVVNKEASDEAQSPVAFPEGCFRLEKIYKLIDQEPIEYDKYYYVDDTHIALPNKEGGQFLFRFSRLAKEIPSNAAMSHEIDIPKALENAVLYYAAAMQIQAERPDVASRLFEQYTELMYTYKASERRQRRVKRG
nr:MAG TPA: hypothetical protein [Caudoviricetes sp.]